MTQSTQRILFGGLLTVGLLASLARGEDKPRPPELLPAPRCAACEKLADCCNPASPCCQENSDCCTKAGAKSPIFSVGTALSACDFSKTSRCKGETVSEDKGRSKFERRVYPVLDLVCPVVLQAAANDAPPTIEDVLIKLIQVTIEPESWSTVGGSGVIEFYPLGKALVVNQTSEVQAQIQELLDSLRRVQSLEAAKAKTTCCSSTDAKPGCSDCQSRAILFKEYTTGQAQQMIVQQPCSQPANAAPSVIIIQQPTAELAELALWAFGNFADWVCGGSDEPEVEVPQAALPRVEGVQKLQDPALDPVSPLAIKYAEWVGQQPQSCPSRDANAKQLQAPVAPPAPVTYSNGGSAGQPIRYVTRDAHGITHVGIEFGAAATGTSPLPPPVPTFRVPPSVSGETTAQAPQPVPCCPVADLKQLPLPGSAPAHEATLADLAVAVLFAPLPGFPSKQQATPLATVAMAAESVPTRLNPFVNPSSQHCCEPRQTSPVTDYRVSVGSGLRIVVPMLGPVPVALDFGIPIVTCPEDKGALLCESLALTTGYTVAPSVTEPRHESHWIVRLHADGDRPALSFKTDSASMECENMRLNWRQNTTLQFAASTNCVHVQGKNFEAEAEAIECREHDGKLVFSGNATLRTFENGKKDCVIQAKKISWDSNGWVAEGASSAWK